MRNESGSTAPVLSLLENLSKSHIPTKICLNRLLQWWLLQEKIANTVETFSQIKLSGQQSSYLGSAEQMQCRASRTCGGIGKIPRVWSWGNAAAERRSGLGEGGCQSLDRYFQLVTSFVAGMGYLGNRRFSGQLITWISWWKRLFRRINFGLSDNVFSIKSWIKNKFCFEENIIDKQFGIPEDFDYLDWVTGSQFESRWLWQHAFPMALVFLATPFIRGGEKCSLSGPCYFVSFPIWTSLGVASVS